MNENGCCSKTHKDRCNRHAGAVAGVTVVSFSLSSRQLRPSSHMRLLSSDTHTPPKRYSRDTETLKPSIYGVTQRAYMA